MAVDMLAVHGIGNFAHATEGAAAAALAVRWADALDVPPDTVAAAYYAHHLRFGYQGTGDDLDRLDAILGGEPRILLEALLVGHGGMLEPAQGRALAPLRQLASWFVARYGAEQAVVERYITPLLREVSLYFSITDPGRRQAVQSTIGAAVSLHRPRVVIAHSLGSVAAYETFWTYGRLGVELLLTIGSPLAFPDQVFDKLLPAPVGGRGRRPPGVRRWINIADPADLVALPRHLGARFDGVDVDQEVAAGAFFTHAAGAYLRTPELRGVIGDHLSVPRSE